MQPEQLHLIRRWVSKAEENYRNAEFVLTLEKDCPLSTICFHSQQCVEKYLKALLISCSLPVPRSHDLLDFTIGFRLTAASNCPVWTSRP